MASSLEAELRDLRNSHIFITGGTGFFGIWLLESLLWANETRKLGLRVTVLSRSPEVFFQQKAPHLKGRRDLNIIPGNLVSFRPPSEAATHIIHCATETNTEPASDWAQRHIDVSINGTRRLLAMAANHRPTAMLVTTSGAVYHAFYTMDGTRCVEGPSQLSDLTSERMVYSQSKRMIEVMTAVAADSIGFRALIARCFAFVGPYLPLNGNYAIGNFIRDALTQRLIRVTGDGTPLRSYLYSADLVVWLLRILIAGKSGVPYNVGGERCISIGDLARLVAQIEGNNTEVMIEGEADTVRPPSAYLPSLERTGTYLGLKESIQLEDAIRRTLNWYRPRLSLS